MRATEPSQGASVKLRGRHTARLMITFLIGGHELGVRQDMTFHGGFELRLGHGPCGKHGVQRIELVEIAMPSDGRARTAIPGLLPVIESVGSAGGQARLLALSGSASVPGERL